MMSRTITIALLAAWLCACMAGGDVVAAGTHAAAASAAPEPASESGGVAAGDAAAIAAAAAEIRAAAGDRGIVVLGEMHGTREVPALAARLAEDYAASGPVRIALELPRDQQAAIDDWIAGGDRVAARAAMRAADPGWSRPAAQNDGRRNTSLFALLDRVHAARAAGRDVGVVAFDLPHRTVRGSAATAASRDASMARALREVQQAMPGMRLVVVTGNVHAMKFVPPRCPQCQPSLASHLADLRPFSVDVSAATGAFFACIEDRPCGPWPISTDPARAGPVSGDTDPFDHRIVLPRFTPAALPAGG